MRALFFVCFYFVVVDGPTKKGVDMIYMGVRYDIPEQTSQYTQRKEVTVITTSNPKIRFVLVKEEIPFQSLFRLGLDPFRTTMPTASIEYSAYMCKKSRGSRKTYSSIVEAHSRNQEVCVGILKQLAKPIVPHKQLALFNKLEMYVKLQASISE